MIYPIAIEHDGTPHSYGVIFPDVAGCISAGNSIKHAIEQAHLALTGHLELMLRDGDSIPPPQDISIHQANPEYAGMTWAVVEIDLDALKRSDS